MGTVAITVVKLNCALGTNEWETKVVDPESQSLVPVRADAPNTGQHASGAVATDTPTVMLSSGPITVDRSHLGAAISEHISPKSPAVLSLAFAAYRDAEGARDHAVARWEKAVDEKSHLQELLHAANMRCSVLEERAKQRSRMVRAQQLANTTGGILAGAGITMLLNPEQVIAGCFVTGAGVVTVLIGSMFSLKEG